MSFNADDASALKQIHDAITRIWPAHGRVLQQNLGACTDEAKAHAAETAALIKRIAAGDLDRFAAGYRWMCGMMLEEELFFRREGRYRRASFAEAEQEVYANPQIMGPYMDGLLVSQAVWSNHIGSIDFFIRAFLPRRNRDRRHLEIGPGHGLLLYYAARDGITVEGWDVSEGSLNHSEACAARLGVSDKVKLTLRNIFEGEQAPTFESIVVSEVLEHLEDPASALKIVHNLLVPGGIAFINVPVNAPTIDHIALFRTPEQLAELVKGAGLTILETFNGPAAGYSEEKARKVQAAMSCCIIVQRPA